MNRAEIRQNGPVAYKRPPKASKPKGQPALILALGLLFCSVVVILVIPKERIPEPIPGLPQEVVGKNKILLIDYEDRKWLSYWRQNKEMLGDPIFAEKPLYTEYNCVGFENYLVCWKADMSLRGSIWQFQPMLLGMQYLPITSRPDDKAALDPLVQRYIIMLEQKGVDSFYWLGMVQSQANCYSDGNCIQIFQRQMLTWKKGDTNPG
jgi:hypothetical protein